MAKILIAEDERDIRDLITFTLRFAGHEVVATSNGEEAFFKAQEVKPDLILMDVRMPRMTGYEACKKMKEIPELQHVPIVFLSAKGQETEVQAGLEAGAVEYILKPFAPDQLTSRVNTLLEEYRSDRIVEISDSPSDDISRPLVKQRRPRERPAHPHLEQGKPPERPAHPHAEQGKPPERPPTKRVILDMQENELKTSRDKSGSWLDKLTKQREESARSWEESERTGEKSTDSPVDPNVSPTVPGDSAEGTNEPGEEFNENM
jgi:DNA-binding response OmpR family regulator